MNVFMLSVRLACDSKLGMRDFWEFVIDLLPITFRSVSAVSIERARGQNPRGQKPKPTRPRPQPTRLEPRPGFSASRPRPDLEDIPARVYYMLVPVRPNQVKRGTFLATEIKAV